MGIQLENCKSNEDGKSVHQCQPAFNEWRSRHGNLVSSGFQCAFCLQGNRMCGFTGKRMMMMVVVAGGKNGCLWLWLG